ncbi:MAG: NAD(P)-dependent oxidoreductase [Chlamydiales bacterium]|nr:NAD(P)-dependent oxidoreductase [Chlamydiales bacterium]
MGEKEVVVVTGSSGRIGTRVIQRLKERYQPIGMDFMGATCPYPEMEFVFVDLSSDESVTRAFDRVRYAYGNKIASIVHLAAFYSFTGQNLELYDKITVQGTRRLLDEAKKFDTEQFIFTSTMLVHDPSKRGVIQNEESHIEGKWHYPASKVRTEHLLHEHKGDVPSVILRIGGCYDHECNCVPISQHIARIYEKQLASVVFPGNWNNGVPYTHFDDLMDQIMLLIEKRKEIPKDLTLLCCEEDSITYRDLQTEIGRLVHGSKKYPMFYLPKAIAKFGAFVQNLNPFGPPPFIKPWMVDLADDNYEFTMDKARKVLGWEPKHNLRKALPAMVENLKKDPVAWYKRHGIPVPKKVKKHGCKCCRH